MTKKKQKKGNSGLEQLATFQIGSRKYGIDVQDVQEIVNKMKMTKVPLAPNFVKGLINLRGQLATAIDLGYFFNLPVKTGDDHVNLVCQTDNGALSLLVDEIGDVIDIDRTKVDDAPSTISGEIRGYIIGVYRVSETLISILDLKKIVSKINGEIKS